MSSPQTLINQDYNSIGAFGYVSVETASKIKVSVNYGHFVHALFKSQEVPLMKLHAALGVCGEAGELADAIKKEIIYEKEPDRANIVEELGDLRFYIQSVMLLYGISEQEVLQTNADKLGKRYVGLKYSDQAAIDRADKKEGV